MSEEDEMIAELVDVGALSLEGMDGEEAIYVMNPEIMKNYFPALYDVMMEEVNDALLGLYERGLVSIEYDENLSPLFTLTEEGEKVAEDIVRNGHLGYLGGEDG